MDTTGNDGGFGMSDLISLQAAIEIIAETDITDGYEPVFSGRQVQALLKDLPSVTIDAVSREVIEDIKKEIKALAPIDRGGNQDYSDYCERDGAHKVVALIDRHISGKE